MGMTIDVQDPKAFAEWCNFIGAIPKADYETRLKADMAAMLDEIKLKAEENIENIYEKDEDDLLQLAQHNAFADCYEQYNDLIQEKINALKGNQKGENEIEGRN